MPTKANAADAVSAGVKTGPAILRPAALPAAARGRGNKTIPLATGAVGAKQLLTGITVIAPGEAIALHTHNCEESVIVIEGKAVAVERVSGSRTVFPGSLHPQFPFSSQIPLTK
ncbi:MAG: hypothetical protein LLG97_14030 [Deltaproteobacteria bacterium]|nr:hypothetical protein [Deltaproteobacteria bacterium]